MHCDWGMPGPFRSPDAGFIKVDVLLVELYDIIVVPKLLDF